MKKEDYYSLARERLLDFSSRDATATLSKEQGVLGLTRLLMCLDELEIGNEGLFLIALPDFTFTRNLNRWNVGIPNGCIITLGKTSPTFIPIDFRPNCCGVVIVKLQEEVKDYDYYVKRYYEFLDSNKFMDKDDFNRRNHFIGLYHEKTENAFYGLVHGSFEYIKYSMYNEHSNQLKKRTAKKNILGNEFVYLLGDAADEYYDDYLKLEKQSIEYREKIAEKVFGTGDVTFHMLHEGFFNKHTLLIGGYVSDTPFKCPMMLAPEVGMPMFSVENPVTQINNSFYCAPHGGGYGLSNVITAKAIGKEYLLNLSNGSKIITNNIIDLPFYYRYNVDKLWSDKYNIGKVDHELLPIYNFKI